MPELQGNSLRLLLPLAGILFLNFSKCPPEKEVLQVILHTNSFPLQKIAGEKTEFKKLVP